MFDAGADFDFAAAFAVVVVGEVGDAAGGEVGVDAEGFSLEVVDGGAAEVGEVVGEDFGGEADGDAFGAFGEDEGEFDGEGDGFAGASVVAELPGGGFGVEDDFAGEGGEARFDVASGGGVVAGEDVAEVALGFDEEGALRDGDEGGVDGGVAVGVVAHGGADDVGDFVEASVVHFVEGVEDAALDGFEAVVDVGNGAVEDDVAGVVEEPGVVVARQGRGGAAGAEVHSFRFTVYGWRCCAGGVSGSAKILLGVFAEWKLGVPSGSGGGVGVER